MKLVFIDHITGLESQVLFLSETMRETAQAREESMSRPRAGVLTSANGMNFLKESEHAGRNDHLKNQFGGKIESFA